MKYKTPTLETKRLILKRGTYEDFVKVYEYDFSRLRNINNEFEFVKNSPEVVKGYENYADKDNVLDFIIYLKETKEPIGTVTLDRYNKRLNSLEISCNLHPNYWRQGYMTEAILELMNYTYQNLSIDNVLYTYAEENYKSKGLSDKIGFKYLKSKIRHYSRIDKNVKEIETIMNKEEFYKIYKK